MKVCVFGGRATTVLPTAQPVPPPPPLEITAHAFKSSQIIPYRFLWAQRTGLALQKHMEHRPLGGLLSVAAKWAVLRTDIVEKTAYHGVHLNPG